MAPRRKHLGWAFYTLAVILLWPSDAFAWGPATHIDYGLEVLKHAALLTPFVRGLLLRHRDDYLYGCCAADIVVGKNWAKELYHCHNWQVGLRVLDAADDGPKKALCYGFLTHLAADTVAHNFYVPYKSVESFRAITARHTYWEVRFDKAVLERPGVWEALRRVGSRKFRDHDHFLGEQLVGASRLFSFGTSRSIFSSMLFLSRLSQWQGMVARLAERSPLPLEVDEVDDYRRLALDAAFAFLIDVEQSRTVRADPTGARSLRVAKELRRELRGAWQRGQLGDERWPALAGDLRRRFRDGIYGRLDMPDAGSLIAKGALA